MSPALYGGAQVFEIALGAVIRNPSPKLLGRNAPALARGLERDELALHGAHHLTLHPNEPPLGIGWRKVLHTQLPSIWSSN